MPPRHDDMGLVRLDRIDLRDLRVKFPLFSTIRVLVVVDSEIEVADVDGSFGVGRFIRLLRETKLGCTRFSVDVASRDTQPFADAGSGGDGHVRYRGFRFDSGPAGNRVIDRYHEMFLFGFKPGNDNGPDAFIDDPARPGVVPMGVVEEAAVTAWMDDGGGVFATGDHDYLGATMCHRIPRVRSMRKWKNADGVPPIGGTTRIDTNQPATFAERLGVATIGTDNQDDATPQPVDWVATTAYRVGLFWYRRPHEVLCHPTLGPIDVMPDHPHEGLCFTPAEIEADPVRRAEFPGAELPQVIAYGDVVPDPPFQQAKDLVNPLRFPMISVYDGYREDVGRIVTDSTWHHWMNMNLDGLEAEGGDEWAKVARYFVNVAKWIAPRGVYSSVCWWELVIAHFHPTGIEELGGRDRLLAGDALRVILAGIHGPCTVREFVFATLFEVDAKLAEGLQERFHRPQPDPCLTCPPIDLVELVVLGAMAEGTRPIAEKVRAALEAGEPIELEAEDVAGAALQAVDRALARFAKEVTTSARGVTELFTRERELAAAP